MRRVLGSRRSWQHPTRACTRETTGPPPSSVPPASCRRDHCTLHTHLGVAAGRGLGGADWVAPEASANATVVLSSCTFRPAPSAADPSLFPWLGGGSETAESPFLFLLDGGTVDLVSPVFEAVGQAFVANVRRALGPAPRLQGSFTARVDVFFCCCFFCLVRMPSEREVGVWCGGIVGEEAKARGVLWGGMGKEAAEEGVRMTRGGGSPRDAGQQGCRAHTLFPRTNAYRTMWLFLSPGLVTSSAASHVGLFHVSPCRLFFFFVCVCVACSCSRVSSSSPVSPACILLARFRLRKGESTVIGRARRAWRRSPPHLRLWRSLPIAREAGSGRGRRPGRPRCP